MNFVEAITKTMSDLQANPTWQREAMIGQGIDPLRANAMAQENADKSESKRMVEMVKARLDAGQPITPQEVLAIGSVNPDLARVVVKMQGGGEQPANVREYQFFNNLSPEEKNSYLTMKRSSQIMNLGGTQAVYDPLTQGKGSEFIVTPKVTDMPEFQGAQSGAKKTAELTATAEGDVAKKGKQAEGTLDLIQRAEQILPAATSGTVGKMISGAANMAGISTDKTKADKQLKVISAGLVANVPRMEGPQSNYDVELYRQAAGDIGNADIPREDRLAALQTIKDIQQKYASGADTAMPSGGGAVIDYNDLPE